MTQAHLPPHPLDDTPQPYHGTPRHRAFFSRHSPMDAAALQQLKQTCGLSMSVGQLSFYFEQLRKENRPTSMEALYLADTFSSLFAQRPETQTLVGLDTDDACLADALSCLISRSRSLTGDAITPPQTLRTVLDAMQAELNATLPPRPYDSDVSLHFTLCDSLTAVASEQAGMPITHRADIAGTPWQLLCHAPAAEPLPSRILRGDILCLLHGKEFLPSPDECSAAGQLLADLPRGTRRRVLPVEPNMLLPTALSCVSGLQVTLGTVNQTPLRYPCDMLEHLPGGWLLVVAPEQRERLTALCAEYGLSLFFFATATLGGHLEFCDTFHGQSVSLPSALLRSLAFSYAYRICPDQHTNISAPVQPTLLPMCLSRAGMGGVGIVSEKITCGGFSVRTAELSLDEEYDPGAITRTLAILRQALLDDGCHTIDQAQVCCGLEIASCFSRTVLWQYVLQLFSSLAYASVPCLPIRTHHTGTGVTRLTISMICRKPYSEVPTSINAPSSSADLPLPDHCSLIHVEHPRVLVVHTPEAGSVDGIARVLSRAGGVVSTLRPTPDAGCTILADAIHEAHLVLFVGNDPSLPDILTHRRVMHALNTLIAKDGLCLGAGDAMRALCQSGLLGEQMQSARFQSLPDAACEGFSRPTAYIRMLGQNAPSVLRPVLGQVARVEDPTAALDPMLGAFIPNRQDQICRILAVSGDDESGCFATRLCGLGGHVLAYADGFDAADLQAAVSYFQ